MSLRFLLDTNALSEPARPFPNPQVVRQIDLHLGEIATAAPVWNEILFGCYRLPSSARRRKIEEYLSDLTNSDLEVLPYESRAAEWHARERARLTRMGRTPSFIDGQIAAVAAVHELVLVTANVADFRLFQGLRVEDWSAA